MIELTFNHNFSEQTASAKTVEILAAQTEPGEGMGPKVFVYHQPVGTDAYFSCVASLPQMADLPEDAAVNPEQPYFRSSSLVLDFRSESLALKFWDKVQEDVRELVADYKASMALPDSTTITIA